MRKAVYSFLNGDLERSYSFYSENATFDDINEAKTLSFDEIKARDQQFLSAWTFDSFDERGYPDYLEYDWNESKVVQSWWNFRMTRKSDGKKIVVPVMFIDDFNNEGKITSRSIYYNGGLLN
jgi:hypothetical protein